MLKGRQTGPMHRGHSWVFRAESHETMMAWYEDIESLISKTGEARNAYVRRHVRTVSGASARTSIDLDEDEADRTPYSAEAVVLNQERPTSAPREPGGRFPSDVQIDRHVQAPLSPSSGESSGGHDLFAAAGSLREGAPFVDGSRSISGRDGSQNRNAEHDGNYGLLVPEQNERYNAGWMAPAEIVARQKQQEESDALGDQRDNLGPNRSSDVHPMLFAGMGSASSRDPSLNRQRNRRESGSTAPTTTNITDHTHNTVPTSIDGDHETSVIEGNGIGHQLRESLKNERAPSNMGSAAATPFSDVTSEGAYGSYMTKPEGDARRSKPSVSALELQIPGHYPPANHIPA
jgi:hypothetical protein